MTTTAPTASSSSSLRPPRRTASIRSILLPLLIIWAAIAVLIYPMVGVVYNDWKRSGTAQHYDSFVEGVPTAEREAALEEARQYNTTLGGAPILDPYVGDVALTDSPEYQDYLGLLNEAEAMGRIRVPDAGIDLPIYHGTEDRALTLGAGHLYGTALPVGGEGSHSVITSHTGLTNATLFDNLTAVEEGDHMYVEVMGQTIGYEVHEIKTILPTELDGLNAEAGSDLLTLFTCYPYGVNSHRLLVTGHRIPVEFVQEVDPLEQASLLKPWMWWGVAAVLLGILLTVLLVSREVRKKHRQDEAIARWHEEHPEYQQSLQ